MRVSARSFEAVFVIAVLLLSSGAFAPLWTDPAKHDVAGGQWELEVVWAVVYLSAGALLLMYRTLLMDVIGHNKLLVLLLCWTALSVLWSEDPAVSARKFVALGGSTLFGLALAFRFRLRELAMLVAGSMAIAAVISLVVSLCNPAAFPVTEQAGDAWNGIFSHKNVLGRSMAFGAIAFLSWPGRDLQSYIVSLGGFGLCAWLIVRSHSQTAMLVIICALTLVLFAAVARWRWRESVGVGVLAILPATAGATLVATHAEPIAAWLHRDITLTGRAKIWDLAWLSVAQHPLLGYGYSAYWWISGDSFQTLALLHYATPHAHNGVLDLALQIGLVGVVLVGALWMLNWLAALKHLRLSENGERWPVLFLTCLIVYSFTESTLLVPNSLLWIMFVAVAVGLSCETRQRTSTAVVLA